MLVLMAEYSFVERKVVRDIQFRHRKDIYLEGEHMFSFWS